MGTYDSDGSVDLHWEFDDDGEVIGPSSAMSCNGEGSSSAGPSYSQLVSNFVGMGFLRDAIVKAVKENGEGNFSAILDSLLTQAVLETSSPECERVRADLSSETAGNFRYDLSDSDSDWASEEKVESLSKKDKTLELLVSMGYPPDEAAIALERCGPNASIMEVTDFICAAQMARSADALFNEDYHEVEQNKRRKQFEEDERLKKKKEKKFERIIDEDDDKTHLPPNPMVAFSLPSTRSVVSRILPKEAIGPPYFYYENVAIAPKESGTPFLAICSIFSQSFSVLPLEKEVTFTIFLSTIDDSL